MNFTQWLNECCISSIAKRAKIDISCYDPKELKMGMKDEKEHKDVTKGDPVKTLKIVISHLKEDKKYYSKIKKVIKAHR